MSLAEVFGCLDAAWCLALALVPGARPPPRPDQLPDLQRQRTGGGVRWGMLGTFPPYYWESCRLLVPRIVSTIQVTIHEPAN